MALGWLFNRLKIWRGRETVLTDDLNAEFQNFMVNGRAEKLAGHSETVGQLQEEFDAGEVGSENLPISTADEIKSLRRQIRLLSGETQWYEDPDTSLKDLEEDLDDNLQVVANRITDGAKSSDGQPAFLLPENAANQVNLLANTTNLVTFINDTKVTFTSDLSLTPLSLAPNANNTCLVNDVSLTGQESSKTQGENGTEIAIDTIGAEISGKDGDITAFKINNGVDDEYFIAEVDTTNSVLKNAQRGWFFDDVGLHIPRVTINDDDVITLMQLSYIFLSNLGGTPILRQSLNQPYVQGTEPSAAVDGDFWLDLTTDRWKRKSGGTFAEDDAVFVGVCLQDDTNCVGARSQDFTRNFSEVNTTDFRVVTTDTIRTKYDSSKVNCYGKQHHFEKEQVEWNMPADLDSGVVEAANTRYYLYVKENGDRTISDIRPHDRRWNLRGYYHPSKPYRCLAEVENNGSSEFDSSTLTFSNYSSIFAGPREIDALGDYSVKSLTASGAVSADSVNIGTSLALSEDANNNLEITGDTVSFNGGANAGIEGTNAGCLSIKDNTDLSRGCIIASAPALAGGYWVQSGSAVTPAVGDGASATVAIVFPEPFNMVPNITVSIETPAGGNGNDYNITYESPTTSGFTARVLNTSGGAYIGTVTVQYIAFGRYF